MEKNLEQTFSDCRKLISSGERIENVILHLHERGVSEIDAIKMIRELFSLSLGEARDLVSAHPAWAGIDHSFEETFLQVLSLGADSTLGDWLEVYFYGFPQTGRFHISVQQEMQEHVETLLGNAVSADEKAQKEVIQQVAHYPDEVIPVLIVLLEQQVSPLLDLILQAIHEIQFPRNAPAIPWLVYEATIQESTALKEVIAILKDIDSDTVVPFFITLLLNGDNGDKSWAETVNRICHVLQHKMEWRLACGPSVAYLLAQDISRQKSYLDRETLLAVLESLSLACNYAIPVLCRLALLEGESLIGKKAKQILHQFNDQDLRPYRPILKNLLTM